MTKRLLTLSLLLVLGACKKQPPPVEAPTEIGRAIPDGTVPGTLPAALAAMKKEFARVHFEYDSAVLSDTSKEALTTNAKIMQSYPSITVEIQGHADERGTTEYNLGLGDRRSEAVRKYLVTMGVPASRVSTVSFGEEAPVDSGSNEVAWSENRRAEFRILSRAGTEPVKGTVE